MWIGWDWTWMHLGEFAERMTRQILLGAWRRIERCAGVQEGGCDKTKSLED